MKKLGYGKDYQYAHNFPDHVVKQQHLPEELKTRKYYVPSDSGYEKEIKARLELWQRKKHTSKS
jgi:putative ATPase